MTADDFAALSVKLDALHAEVSEVKDLARETNGRVDRLELWRARREGAMVALSWFGPVVTGVITGLVIWVFTH